MSHSPRKLSLILSAIPYLGSLAWLIRKLDTGTRRYVSITETIIYCIPTLFWPTLIFVAIQYPESSERTAPFFALWMLLEIPIWPLRILRTVQKNRELAALSPNDESIARAADNELPDLRVQADPHPTMPATRLQTSSPRTGKKLRQETGGQKTGGMGRGAALVTGFIGFIVGLIVISQVNKVSDKAFKKFRIG